MKSGFTKDRSSVHLVLCTRAVTWFNPCNYYTKPTLLSHFIAKKTYKYLNYQGFPGGASGKEPTCQCRRYWRRGFDPWIRKIPWRRAWQPTPVFLPGEPHGLQPTRLLRPWDFPGKSTGMGCHCLLRACIV